MRRLGVFLVVTGFGSIALHYFTDYQFRVLAWADDRQPGVGLAAGLVGLLLLLGPALLSNLKGGGATSPAPSTGGFRQPTPPVEPVRYPPAQPNSFAQYPPAPWGQAAPFSPAQPNPAAGQFPPAQFPPAPGLPGQFPPPRFDHPIPPGLPARFQQQVQPPRWGQQPIDPTVRLNAADAVERTAHLNQQFAPGQFPPPGQRPPIGSADGNRFRPKA